MSPYLTAKGKWVFLVGVFFVLAGALFRQPLLVAMGQVPFLMLVTSVALLMPGARGVDRRAVRLGGDWEEGKRQVRRLNRGDDVGLDIVIENGTNATVRLGPFRIRGAGPVEVESVEAQIAVGSGQSTTFAITIRSVAVGRSSLQGMDVVVGEPLGFVATHDYLPCLQVFETYPTRSAIKSRRASVLRATMGRALYRVDRSSRAGMDLRELREHQPGDPLRTVAWKATVRQRRLITRAYEDQRDHSEYVALDISTSMRAGNPPGEKFEDAIDMAFGLCIRALDHGRSVGFWSFDHELYGELRARRGPMQRRRIQRHMVGLRSIVSPGRTALDDRELEEALADYLLVQERLDFRHGRGLQGEVDGSLLRRWLTSAIRTEAQHWAGPGEAHGVVGDEVDAVRRYFRLRGIPLPPPSEGSAGAKVSGVEAVLEAAVRRGEHGRLTVISDLCGLNDVESLERPISVARRRGMTIRFLVPFTPHYGVDSWDPSTKVEVVRELFTLAERKDRLQLAQRLASMGIKIRFAAPELAAGE